MALPLQGCNRCHPHAGLCCSCAAPQCWVRVGAATSNVSSRAVLSAPAQQLAPSPINLSQYVLLMGHPLAQPSRLDPDDALGMGSAAPRRPLGCEPAPAQPCHLQGTHCAHSPGRPSLHWDSPVPQQHPEHMAGLLSDTAFSNIYHCIIIKQLLGKLQIPTPTH